MILGALEATSYLQRSVLETLRLRLQVDRRRLHHGKGKYFQCGDPYSNSVR